jgi:N-acetylneuraminate lyase
VVTPSAESMLPHTAWLAVAREEQYRSVQLIRLLSNFGYLASSRAVMEMLGIPVGPPRLPTLRLEPGRETELRAALEKVGFFDLERFAG